MRWVGLVFVLMACGRPVEAELSLTLAHPEPLILREVLVERFREASAKGKLPLAAARAVPSEERVELSLTVVLPGACDDAALNTAMDTAAALTTGAGVLAIHEASPEGAKALADLLRERLARDVVVPFDRQGLVVVPVSDAAILRAFEAARPELLVVSTGDEHWVVVRAPALTGADLASTELSTRDRVSVDLIFTSTATTRLRELTERSRQRPLPILLDGELALTPVLASRAAEGRLRIELGDRHALAERLAMTTLAKAPTVVSKTARCRESR